MNVRRKLGIFLIVAGVLTGAASGLVWRQHAPELARIHADNATFEDSLQRVHKELVHTSLLLRGLKESEPSLPDTVRRYGAGKMMELTTGYNKHIRKLDMTERDIKLEIASLKRDSAREVELARKRTIPLAAAGLAALVIGLVLAAIPARRVGA